jgi:hypothetical protein
MMVLRKERIRSLYKYNGSRPESKSANSKATDPSGFGTWVQRTFIYISKGDCIYLLNESVSGILAIKT